MAVVANLDAVLGAKIENFDRGMNGAIVTTDKLSKQLKEAGLTQRDWNKIVKEGERVTAAMRTPLEIYEQEIRDLDRLLKAGRISQETYNRAVTQSRTALNAASPAQQRMNQLMAEGRSITASMRTPLEIYEQELIQLNQLLRAGAISQETFNRSVAQSNTTLAAGAGNSSRFAGAIGNVKALGASFLALGAITALSDLSKDAIQLEEQLTQSTAIIGGLNADLRKQLIDGALDVSEQTKFSANEAAEAYFFLFSAGLDAQQSIAAIPQVAKFAQAGAFDLATATDLATDAQSALGLTVVDTSKNLANLTRVTDTLIAANTLSNATAQQFSESLTNKAGASIRALGKDVEEGVAVLAAFADQGVKGAEAGTQLSIVIRDLQTKAIQFRNEFAENNIAVFEDGEVRNFADILGDLEKQIGNLNDEAKKTKLLELGFSDKSVSAIQTLFGTSEKIRQYESDLRRAGRVTEEVANNQFTSLSGATNRMEAAFDTMTSKNEVFLESMAALVDLTAVGVENFNAFSDLLENIQFPDLGFLNAGDVGNILGTSARDLQKMIGLINEFNSATDADQALSAGSEFLDSPLAGLFLGQERVDELRNRVGLFDKEVKEATRSVVDLNKSIANDVTTSNDSVNKELEKLQTRGEQIARSLRTPFEIFQDNLAELNQLLDIGAINANTFERGIAREREQLNQATDQARTAAASLGNTVRDSIARNSEKAFEIIFGNQNTRQPDVEELKTANQLQQKTNVAIENQTKTIKQLSSQRTPVNVVDW